MEMINENYCVARSTTVGAAYVRTGQEISGVEYGFSRGPLVVLDRFKTGNRVTLTVEVCNSRHEAPVHLHLNVFDEVKVLSGLIVYRPGKYLYD